jgi:DNA-binding SARP family transcriptional activator/tetratricopeptide (TPR) repeat protein
MLRFEILGPVRCWNGATEIDVGSPGQRAVLAALLIRRGRPMSRNELVDALWADDPPAGAANVVHKYVAGLRRALEPDRPNRAPSRVVRSVQAGYQIRNEGDQLDLDLFDAHVAAARRLSGGGAAQGALRELDAALALWQGPPLGGIRGAFVAVEGARLAELRLAIVDERAQTLLDLDRPADLVVDLPALIAEHPFRERLRSHLMLALYRNGRPADALAVYQDARQVMVAELGLEPGPELESLQRQILANDPSLRLAPPSVPVASSSHAWPTPAELPHDIASFTARRAELEELHSLITIEPNGGDHQGARIAVLGGAAGAGKTALAVHWAHQVAERFPDGQLYLDLHGFSPAEPLDSTRALARLLDGLGVEPDRLPVTLEERVARYRTLLAGRRVLIVLDNAVSAEQVRPLLPGGQQCLALVTSRATLSGLVARDGAHPVALGVLTPPESIALLAGTLGADRIAAEPDAAADLAGLCGHLPLALRIAASRAATRPRQPLGELVADLAVERDRLDALAAEGDAVTAIRTVFSWSYRVLSPPAVRAFRFLGLHAGADIGRSAAAALTGAAEIGPVLAELTHAHLVEQPARHRYRLHELVKLYAAERAEAEEEHAERRAAIGRWLDWYLHAADAADRFLIPQRRRVPLEPWNGAPVPVFTGYDDALDWCLTEHANLIAAVRQAAEVGALDVAWKLPVALWGYFTLRRPSLDWVATHQIGLTAARRLGDLSGEAHVLGSLAFAYRNLGRLDEALECATTALDLCRRVGDVWGEGIALIGLTMVRRDQGEPVQAMAACHLALAIWRRTGDEWGQAHTLNSLADIYRDLRRYEDARQCQQDALEVFERSQDRFGQVRTLNNLGSSYRALGRFAAATECLTRALRIGEELGDRGSQAEALEGLAAVQADFGDPRQAQAFLQTALEIFQEIGDPRADSVRQRLGARASRDRLPHSGRGHRA